MYRAIKFDNIIEAVYSTIDKECDWGYALRSCAEYFGDVKVFILEDNVILNHRHIFSSDYLNNETFFHQDIISSFDNLFKATKRKDDYLIFKTPVQFQLPIEFDLTKTNTEQSTLNSVFCYHFIIENIKYFFCIILNEKNIDFTDKQTNDSLRIGYHIRLAVSLLISKNKLKSQTLLFYEIYNTLDIPVIITNGADNNIEFINISANYFLEENFNSHKIINIGNNLQQLFSLRPIDGINNFYICDSNNNFLVSEKTIINFPNNKLISFLDIRLKENSNAINLIHSLYKLTKSELNLTFALLKGVSIIDYSKDHHISINTTRSHLKAIFKKTGTNKQSELLSLLCRIVIVSSNFNHLN